MTDEQIERAGDGPSKAFLEQFAKTGGPAHGNLTVRDYFAAKAMQAIVSRAGYAYGSDQPQCASDIADNAFVLADAMLEARK